jgi:hypothetical protein
MNDTPTDPAVDPAREGLYLYGLAAGDDAALAAALTGVDGVAGASPTLLDLGGRAIIASPHPCGEILRTRRRMLAHTRVLEAAMQVATVLPMRFGLIASDRADVAAMVADHAAAVDAQLARIAGQVEIGLRVSFPREAALAAVLADRPDLAAARDRLRGRGASGHFERVELGRQVAEALDRRRTESQRALAARLAPLCTDHVLRTPEEDIEVLRAECLLPAEAEPGFASAVQQAVSHCTFAPGAEPSIRLVGPVPPYHFVDLVLGRPGAEAA